jgi:hypothetical protein
MRLSIQRAEAVEDMICEVLSRPECYDINRLIIVTHLEDAWSKDGDRIEIYRKAAGRHPRKFLAGIRFRIIATGLDV